MEKFFCYYHPDGNGSIFGISEKDSKFGELIDFHTLITEWELDEDIYIVKDGVAILVNDKPTLFKNEGVYDDKQD